MDLSYITVNAQNSIRINANGTIIYVDPYQIDEENHDADFIFITHDHYDHYSLESINKILQRETAFIVPIAMDKKVRKSTPVGINNPVEPGKSYEVNGLSFETVAMYNKLKPFHPKKSGWCGYIIDVSGTRIYIAGDIDDIDEAKAVKCDIAMIPIGGFYTMNYKEGAGLINTMKPQVAIPTHYGTAVGSPSDGESFAKLVDKDIQVEIKLSF
ncbi:MAG: MBL fold metallo-hydrolase [Eubacterium sp.]|nr:MBL fold metallo-hydrolase [Eubacterium sp.]